MQGGCHVKQIGTIAARMSRVAMCPSHVRVRPGRRRLHPRTPEASDQLDDQHDEDDGERDEMQDLRVGIAGSWLGELVERVDRRDEQDQGGSRHEREAGQSWPLPRTIGGPGCPEEHQRSRERRPHEEVAEAGSDRARDARHHHQNAGSSPSVNSRRTSLRRIVPASWRAVSSMIPMVAPLRTRAPSQCPPHRQEAHFESAQRRSWSPS